jgi:hypothetical protein
VAGKYGETAVQAKKWREMVAGNTAAGRAGGKHGSVKGWREKSEKKIGFPKPDLIKSG